MPYRNMSLEDFAAYVGMDARDVRKMADRGKLPAQKIGGEWRFNRARVTEWLQQEMHTLEPARLISLERAMGEAGAKAGMIVTNLIGLEGVEVTLPARTKASVLREMVNLAERTGMLYDAEGLHEALREREDMCSTALPNGVAIPHPRQPMPYVSAEPLICVGRVPAGIAFGTTRELTRIFILVCCHEDRHHLRVLARLMRILDPPTIQMLHEVETAEDLLKTLIDKETEVIAETA